MFLLATLNKLQLWAADIGNAFLNANHARDKVTCRSVSGICMMINHTVVKTVSKRQSTVESSTYGSELVAARIATDMAVETLYTLQMLGVSIDGSILLLGDNKSVVLNTTIPSSALKKKHNAIAYHRVRGTIAARIICFCHIDTQVNLADIFTKPLGNDDSSYPVQESRGASTS